MAMALVLLLANAVRADIPAPPEVACGGKRIGSYCTLDGKEGTCQMGKHRFYSVAEKKEVESDAIVCQPIAPAKQKPPEKAKDQKKSAFGEGGARGSLALALLACGAGVLLARRRHARP
jgi:hypothetical protein